MSLEILVKIRLIQLWSILTWLVSFKTFKMIWCPETQMQKVLYPQICSKGSAIGVHEVKQNCHPVNAIYGQDWHSEMIHYVWTDWKLGHAFPSYEGNAPLTCREGHNLYTKSIYMYFHAHDGWLPVQHPEFLQHLRQCYHAVWHSSWYLSTDLVIKLACMWS